MRAEELPRWLTAFARRPLVFLRRYRKALRHTTRELLAENTFEDELAQFKSLVPDDRFGRIVASPCMRDREEHTPFDRHYIYHQSWAARVVAECRPQAVVDVSSILSFSCVTSAFVPVTLYEFRPPKLTLNGLTVLQGDACNLDVAAGSVPFLSCMHVVEHIGLGRYGDPIDPDGDRKATRELVRVLSDGGDLLFVVPMSDQPRVEFNGHRVYSYELARQLFADLELVEFSLITEGRRGALARHCEPTLLAGQKYACGCFHFRKGRGQDPRLRT